MAIAFCLFVAGSFLLVSVSGQTLVDGFRGEIHSCETTCQKSYPGGEGGGGADDQVRLFSFCRSGCRLLNVIDVLDTFDDLNDTKLACFKCCDDSYLHGQSVGACKFGCESQVASTKQRRQQIEAYCYSQQLDSMSPSLFFNSILSRVIEIPSDQMSQTQTLSGGLVVIAAGSSLVSDADDDLYGGMNLRGMIIGSVGDMPSLPPQNDDPSSVNANKPPENNLALKSDVIFHSCLILKTGISRLLAACLLILSVLLIIWIWTSATTDVAKQDRKLLLEKQNLKYLLDDDDDLQVFVTPSSDDIKDRPPPPPPPPPPHCATDASHSKRMELIDIGSPLPLKFKVETV